MRTADTRSVSRRVAVTLQKYHKKQFSFQPAEYEKEYCDCRRQGDCSPEVTSPTQQLVQGTAIQTHVVALGGLGVFVVRELTQA